MSGLGRFLLELDLHRAGDLNPLRLRLSGAVDGFGQISPGVASVMFSTSRRIRILCSVGIGPPKDGLPQVVVGRDQLRDCDAPLVA
ncbi:MULTISPECIES: hypothetical protein [Bradyrhizobium]|uniref:Uncharacterized protein n=1 Tax=Bradyrhizobium retamae TaxID=1300035 RepID=A0A0R3MFV8_9BRAD|nr:hypothetical protein [Bradyrhizobium retamae]KRR19112.1 hypothetical protein CQ13_34320 [Bradyrhizobium retamae]